MSRKPNSYVIPSDLLHEAHDTIMASTAESDISDDRRSYRQQLLHRVKSLMDGQKNSLFRFTTRELILLVTIICVALGGYQLGHHKGKRYWHLKGYAEAEDHYIIMLQEHAKKKQVWDMLGDIWRKPSRMTILGAPLETEKEWRQYVQQHIHDIDQRSGDGIYHWSQGYRLLHFIGPAYEGPE